MGNLKTENTSYPATLDTATLIADGVDEVVASHINGVVSAVLALETEVGTIPKGTAASLAARLNVLLHSDGGLLRGSSFPGTPSPSPHFFWRTDEQLLYLYNTTTSAYVSVSLFSTLDNYVSKSNAATITAEHTFNPLATAAPFILGANAIDQKVTGLNADKVDGYSTAEPSTASTIPIRNSDGDLTAKQFISDIADGTAPLVVTSTTKVTNLNADLLDGATTATAETADTIALRNASGDLTARQFTSTVATGTAPFVVASTTEVANLKAATATSATSAGSATTATTADRVTDGTNNIRTKIISIGDWDMDTTASVNIAHGLTHGNIRGVSAWIKDDANEVYDINAGGYAQTNYPSNITLVRNGGGIFDSTTFDQTSYNRGWIVITYVE